jgi:hypothetical protein
MNGGGEEGDFKRQDADVSIASSSQANTAWLSIPPSTEELLVLDFHRHHRLFFFTLVFGATSQSVHNSHHKLFFFILVFGATSQSVHNSPYEINSVFRDTRLILSESIQQYMAPPSPQLTGHAETLPRRLHSFVEVHPGADQQVCLALLSRRCLLKGPHGHRHLGGVLSFDWMRRATETDDSDGSLGGGSSSSSTRRLHFTPDIG